MGAIKCLLLETGKKYQIKYLAIDRSSIYTAVATLKSIAIEYGRPSWIDENPALNVLTITKIFVREDGIELWIYENELIDFTVLD